MFLLDLDAWGRTVCRMLALLELGMEVVGGGSTRRGRQRCACADSRTRYSSIDAFIMSRNPIEDIWLNYSVW